jgi:MinD superfamily P-loop ATPase
MTSLLVLSGKGGAGKTTVASSLIKLFDSKVYADVDVDAPNLHLIMQHNFEPQREDYYGSKKAIIDPKKCVGCGKCATSCRFHSINKTENGKYKVNEFACEGCSVCDLVCQYDAVAMVNDISGETQIYQDDKYFSTAKLKMGRGNSGKLVTQVKDNLIDSDKLIIIDGSPGIGCPVLASITGVDYVLLVTESTISGLHDMKRIAETCESFQTPYFICINRADISTEVTEEIEEYCLNKNVEMVGKIPYDKEVSKCINDGVNVADTNIPASIAIKEIFINIKTILKKEEVN